MSQVNYECDTIEILIGDKKNSDSHNGSICGLIVFFVTNKNIRPVGTKILYYFVHPTHFKLTT